MERYRQNYLDENKRVDATNEASQMAGYLDYIGHSAGQAGNSAGPTRPMSKDGSGRPTP